MSETAQTLAKAALRAINAITTGETPTHDELSDALEAMKLMLRNWSARNIRVYYTKQESLSIDGSASYTIGSGGDLDTVRPTSIRGAWTSDGDVKIITEDRYRQIRMNTESGGPVAYLWYSPEYPLGVLYPYPYASGTLYIDSLKPLTEPSALTSDVSFPPEYDDAIKWNLAVRLAPEYEKEVSQTVASLAISTMAAIENLNFLSQVNAVRPEVIKITYPRYNIDNG